MHPSPACPLDPPAMHAFARFCLFFLLAASLVAATPAHPRSLLPSRVRGEADALPRTNAARLARGLPPLSPRSLFDPTRTCFRTHAR
jgi:hypothetical protein